MIKLLKLLLNLLIVCALFCTTASHADSKLPTTDIRKFTTVVEHIRNYYVTDVPDNVLFENAIRGMLNGLDPHSAYLDVTDFNDLRSSTSGKFVGLGIEVTMEEGFVKIITPIDDSPATKADLRSGDLIIRLDDVSVRDLTLKDALDRMQGTPGSKIKLTILRKGEEKPLIKDVTRAVIAVNSYAYLRVSLFQSDSGQELKKAIKKIINDKSLEIKGMVLDLRNNPGGILDAAVEISDIFLDKATLGYDGVIVSTKGRDEDSEIRETASNRDLTNNLPLIVLVNRGSASAAEIVTAALQTHKRAIIMGTTTFGKGSVQTIIPFRDNKSGLKLTTALYYAPNGRSIQATGVQPDIIVESIEMPEHNGKHASNEQLMLREADLQGHLTSQKAEQVNSKIEQNSILYKDYQLQQAINLLKGIRAYK
jgi:carboxyl-terminal processing protease